MRLKVWFAGLALIGVATVTFTPITHGQQEKGGMDMTGPYDVVESWWKPPNGHRQHVSGVLAETPDRIFVTTTNEVLPTPEGARGTRGPVVPAPVPGAPPLQHHFILVFDAKGNVVEEWTQWSHLFNVPHKVRMNPYDPAKHIWVIDKGTHQVFEFTNDGKQLVMTLGEKSVRRADQTHFSVPADMAFLPDGSFFVVEEGEDGQPPRTSSVNSRIIKFDKNGKFLLAWETKGKGAGQFDLAHGIAIDKNRRLYVTEENTHRVQIFDENGKYLDEWPNIYDAVDVLITKDQFAWVVSGNGNKIIKYDLDGHMVTQWGTYGTFEGGLNRVHQISTDSNGNLYIADSGNNRLQKFKPKATADRSRLVGQPF